MPDAQQPSASGDLSAAKNPEERERAPGEVYNVHAAAERLQDGTLRVTVSGTTQYGAYGRKTSATIDVTDDLDDQTSGAILDAFDHAMSLGKDRLARRLARDAQLAVNAAIRDPEDAEEEVD